MTAIEITAAQPAATALGIQLAGLQTETRNPRTTAIDQVSTEELCRIFHREDSRVHKAVEPCIPIIAQAIEAVTDRLRQGGRLFYIGAGTSGRLGVLDASELPPTYSASPDRFIALIAGGDHALRHALEGAEDSREGAETDLEARQFDPEVDSVIGIAASGRTPYVLGGLEYARARGATTIGVVCVKPSAVETEGNADYLIATVPGPEVVTGSTRMKAGTATKMVLNMMSTGIMIRLGKTYGNLMIDMRATNLKLEQRARNILRLIGGSSCTQSDQEIDCILQKCHGSVKLAAVVIVLRVSVAEAEERLRRNKEILAQVFEEYEKECATKSGVRHGGLVLCVDAGGTSSKAVILSKDGSAGSGTAGPCNVSSIGIEGALSSISHAVQEAVDNCQATTGQKFQDVTFEAVWVGIAGYDRPALSAPVDTALTELLKLAPGRRPKVTTDIDLLPSALSSTKELDSAIVLVAGTGSIAMSYKRTEQGFKRTARVGGWGRLLGDDGSGYGIGREALRKALYEVDLYRMSNSTSPDVTLSPLSQAICNHFKEDYPASKPEDLLSTVVMPDSAFQDPNEAAMATTKRISSVAKVVISMAETDNESRGIAESGTTSLAQLVTLLIKGQGIDPSRCGLVLAGGLMQDDLYRTALVEAATKEHGGFAETKAVTQPAMDGARLLMQDI